MKHSKEIILTYFPTSLGAKFKPLFISFTYSRYDEEKVVWRADLTQEDAIGFCMERHDDEIMDVVQTAIIDDPHNEMVVHLTNPCHHGFIFSAFQIGESLYKLHRIIYVHNIKAHRLSVQSQFM